MAANDNQWTAVAAEMGHIHPIISDSLRGLVLAAMALAKQPGCDLLALERLLDSARDDLEPGDTDLSRKDLEILADCDCAMQAIRRVSRRLRFR